MASVFTGYPGVVLVETERGFDPNSGDTFTVIYEGPKQAIESVMGAHRIGGWQCQMRKSGGVKYRLTATIGSTGEQPEGSANEIPVDRYRIVTQTALLDIRSNPNLIEAYGGEGKLAALLTAIDKDIGEGKDGAGYSGANKKLFNLRARGAQSYQLKRPVLSRVRKVTTKFPGQFVMEAQPVVYTTAALIKAFAIPPDVVRRLPKIPATEPSDTEWAWYWDQQDSDIIPIINRVEEIDTWIFAAWSTLLYDVISTPA